MLKIAVLLGFAVALSYAVTPEDSVCCTPDQWEGGQGSVIGYSGFIRKGLIREYISVSYDFTNKRSASILYYQNGKIRGKFQTLARYCDDDQNCGEKGKLYIVNLEREKCYVKNLKLPFRQACVPKTARHVGDAYLGLTGGLKISSYELDGERFMATVSVSKLKNGQCVPIGEIIAKKGRYTTLRDAGFVNITPGIKNATVFDIPKACDGVKPRDDVAVADDLLEHQSIFTL